MVGFVNTTECHQSASLTSPTTSANVGGRTRPTSGSELSSEFELKHVALPPLREPLIAFVPYFTSSISLRLVLGLGLSRTLPSFVPNVHRVPGFQGSLSLRPT